MSAEPSRESDPPAALDDEATVAELKTRVEVLREENRRLREESRRLTRARYRQTALGLLAVGVVAALAGLVLSAAREVFVVLAGVGAFGAVLTYYLTPERFITVSVGERVYATLAENGDRLVAEFGLTDHRVYVPTGDGARLFVPQHETFEVPDPADLDSVAVVPEERRERGVALEPTGARLYEAFDRVRTVEGGEPDAVAAGLADAVVEQFELAAGARADVDSEDGRVTVGVDGSALGSVTRFDHPIASLVATGLAAELDEPVRLTATDAGEGRADEQVTCRWAVDDENLADL